MHIIQRRLLGCWEMLRSYRNQSAKAIYIKAQGWSRCIASYSVLQLLCSVCHGVILAAYNDACALHCLPRCLHARTSCKGEIGTIQPFPCSQNKEVHKPFSTEVLLTSYRCQRKEHVQMSRLGGEELCDFRERKREMGVKKDESWVCQTGRYLVNGKGRLQFKG